MLVALVATFLFAVPTVSSSCRLQSPVSDMSSVVVIDKFRAPKCERCAGNRGIELQLHDRQQIFAASDGVISYYGVVGRTKYLVLLTQNNRRITYGKIAESNLRAGDVVFAGQQIALSGPILYFGIREVSGNTVQYVDPTKYLTGALGTWRKAVLVREVAAGQEIQDFQNNGSKADSQC